MRLGDGQSIKVKKMTILASNDFAIAGTFLPAGTTLAWSGDVCPEGWLVCQGTYFLRSDYPQLFDALGTTYNTQIDPTTGGNYTDPGILYFRIPDYRGIFLRNTGTPSGLDTVSLGGWQGQKTRPNGLGLANAGYHNHTLNDPYGVWGNDGYMGSVYGGGGSYRYSGFTGPGQYYSNQIMYVNGGTNFEPNHGHGFSGDNETRPLNKGVYWIIKY